MTKSIDEDGTEYTETKAVLNCQQRFYKKKIYDENNNINDRPIEITIGENSRKLSDLEAEKIEGEILLTELSEALKI